MKREPPVARTSAGADLQIDALGDRAIHIRLGDVADEATRTTVRAYFERLIAQPPAGVHDVVPGFASLALHYDPAKIHRRGDAGSFEAMAKTVRELLADVDTRGHDAGRLIEIPVCYDATVAPDLDAVASHTGLTTAEVVALHVAPEYVVHMIGFLPGFPYLGGLDPRLTAPRRASPRGKVPAGSVGIGGGQTGVYTIESPGGWQLIGRTPTRLFDVRRDPPAKLKIGDRVRFRPIALDEYGAASAT